MDRGIGRRLMVSRWGCRQEGDFTYDSASALSKKSGCCHFAQTLLSERRSAAGETTKIKHLAAPGVRDDPNLEPTPACGIPASAAVHSRTRRLRWSMRRRSNPWMPSKSSRT